MRFPKPLPEKFSQLFLDQFCIQYQNAYEFWQKQDLSDFINDYNKKHMNEAMTLDQFHLAVDVLSKYRKEVLGTLGS